MEFDTNGVGHINKVKLRRARFVLGLMTTFGGSTISVFSRLLRPTQPGHPSGNRRNEYTGDGFGHRWGRNGEFCVEVGPGTRTAGILTYCMLAKGLTLTVSKVIGDELTRDRSYRLCVNLLLNIIYSLLL